MILQYMKYLKEKKIVLASSSPRRKEILEKLGWNLTIVPSEFEETLKASDYDHPGEFAIATAQGKAREVASRLENTSSEPYLIIGADTCVSLNEVFGKPKDREDAYRMLSLFSGKHHEVVTGVSVMVREEKRWNEINFFEKTTVHFGELSPDEINAYIDTGEPMDKAGGYGIQALGGTLVAGIEGDYYNVMGFPLHRFCLSLVPVLDKLKISVSPLQQ